MNPRFTAGNRIGVWNRHATYEQRRTVLFTYIVNCVKSDCPVDTEGVYGWSLFIFISIVHASDYRNLTFTETEKITQLARSRMHHRWSSSSPRPTGTSALRSARRTRPNPGSKAVTAIASPSNSSQAAGRLSAFAWNCSSSSKVTQPEGRHQVIVYVP